VSRSITRLRLDVAMPDALGTRIIECIADFENVSWLMPCVLRGGTETLVDCEPQYRPGQALALSLHLADQSHDVAARIDRFSFGELYETAIGEMLFPHKYKAIGLRAEPSWEIWPISRPPPCC
jgi:hypothetical protein